MRKSPGAPGRPALPMEEAVGAAIRELRQREGLTLAQVSEQAGISRGMLSKIENGQTSAGMDSESGESPTVCKCSSPPRHCW